jgi:hypothetical protein
MMVNKQERHCHAEHIEASLHRLRETLRRAQVDKLLPILVVKIHNRPQWKSGLSWEFRSKLARTWLNQY